MLLRVDACPLGSMRALLRAVVQVDSPKREQGDTQTQRLRRDDKFIMVAWMNLASRSKMKRADDDAHEPKSRGDR